MGTRSKGEIKKTETKQGETNNSLGFGCFWIDL